MWNRSVQSRARWRRRRGISLVVIIGAVVATVVGPACKPRPPVPVIKGPDGKIIEPPPPARAEDETAASALKADARKLEAEGDTAGAAAKLDLLVDSYPGTAAGARELEVRGDKAEGEGDVQTAIGYFEKLLFFRPSFPGADNVRERYAGLLLRVDRLDDAANMLRALRASARAPADRGRLGMTLADTLSELQRAREALELYVEVHSVVGADKRKKASDRAYDITAGGLSFKEAEDLWDDVEGKHAWAFILPALTFKLAKIYYHTRDYGRSEDMARLVTGRWASSDFGSQARDLLVRLNNRKKVEPRRIGVILPLSGRYQQYGKRSLDAIKLAFGKNSTIELVIKDTEGNARIASKGVRDLVFESHAIAIIGPLFSGEALGAALKAEELSVPIIALSHRKGLPEIGGWVFRTALTVEAQAHALAKTAFDDLGMKRYALLYPRSRYGKTFADAFWDEVDRRNGEIRGVESYEHNQTTFQEPVRKLVGRYYDMSRRDFRMGLTKCKNKRLSPHREK
ncbi:MAG: penicillin-binding protein activator, partial [Myxococcota bacterium]